MSATAPSMFTPAAKEMAQSLGLKLGRANLDVFAETLTELARADRNILAVTSDSRGSGKLAPFGKELPEQIVEIGIAEQNLVGVAAGLASVGKRVFAVSPACFLTARALEQVKNDVAYSDHPVVLVGISAGVSYGALGSTHHSLHDIAALRAIHNLTVLAPADNTEADRFVRLAAGSNSPVYLRFGKASLYDLAPATSAPDSPPVAIQIGRARRLLTGRDACFIATGEAVIHARLAAAHLASTGLQVGVLSVPSIKPLDRDSILAQARATRAIVTVEEHSTHGGLGEAVASTLLEAGVAPRFKIVGIPDEYTITGAQADIFRHYGISMEGLAQTMRSLLT